jgi:cytochrome c2
MTIKKLSFLLSIILLTVFSVPFNAIAQTAPAPTDAAATTAAPAAGGAVAAAPAAGGKGDAVKGEATFNSNCASCHKLDGVLTGPALSGVVAKWEGAGEYKGMSGHDWLKRWIKNWQDPVTAGYPYAVQIQNFSPTTMQQFPNLSDEAINNILAYIQNPPAKVAETPVAGAGGEQKSPLADAFAYILIAILIVVAVILWRVSSSLNRMIATKEGTPIPDAVPFYKSRKFWGTAILVILVLVGNATVNGAIDLGRNQGYAPVQPIKFPHDIHAGIDKIDCQYCHSGAAKSKHANIPSVNTCMNCHKGIKEAAVHGKTGRSEITKIYAAIGFNPNTGNYIPNYQQMPKPEAEKIFREWVAGDKNGVSERQTNAILAQIQKPIEWVRVHNLPDHVYFNHSQHVVVGGVQCQTCHGPVEEMKVVYQHAPLSMGWCISCHRTREVNFTGNDYYKTFAKYQEEVKAGKLEKVTVEKLGGTECQKCHY